MKVYDYLKKKNRAQSLEDLSRALKLEPESGEELIRELDQLEKEGKIRKSRQGKYLINHDPDVFTGHLSQTGKSYGFFIHDEGTKPDVFIHGSKDKGAMDGDQVLMRLLPSKRGDSQEGEVIKILSRKHRRVLGVFQKTYVQPLSRKIGPIFIQRGKSLDARVGEIVEVEILRYEEGHRGMEGKILRTLGEEGEAGLDAQVVMEEFDLPSEFPEEVLQEARSLTLPSSTDRRRIEEIIFTMDGADAKDFDDAISIIKTEKGYQLGVHIADVSHYVKEGSALDQEALKRGTSVYLVDTVVPMLPEELSNELCSLNPGEDKYCLSVLMDLDEKGNVLSSDLFPSVLQSSHRLVYDEVTAFLEGEENPKLEVIRRELECFKELTMILQKRRDQRGAMDFGSNEPEFILDDKGWPLEVKAREQGFANSMIEEAMILTNEVVGQHFHWLQIPFLYRNHEKPSREKMVELNELLHSFGYLIKGSLDEVHPKQLSDLLKEMKGKPEENILPKMMLRSLKQAHYSEVLQGHFGLALEYYSHFTAPIRRYPDLQIHRIIKESLHALPENRRKHYEAILPAVAQHSSDRERVADEAERRMDSIKKAEYMKDHLGEVFQGKVSGVTNFGVFVELENTVEGMIRLDHLQDFYRLDKENMCLRGDLGGKISLGQGISVKAASVEVYLGEINFLPVDEDEATSQ